MVSKTTLACTAAYNAGILFGRLYGILMNLDQSVAKQATVISEEAWEQGPIAHKYC